MQIDKNNYATMLFMSKEVSLPKMGLVLQKLKMGPKSNVRPVCMEAFNYELSRLFSIYLSFARVVANVTVLLFTPMSVIWNFCFPCQCMQKDTFVFSKI